MTTFEEVLYKAKNIAEAAGKKTSDMLEATRLKMTAAEIEKDIAATLEGLGRLIYDGRKAEEDVTATVDECILKLDELNKKLEEAREAISAFKNLRRCRECGADNQDDAIYCKKCGAKLAE